MQGCTVDATPKIETPQIALHNGLDFCASKQNYLETSYVHRETLSVSSLVALPRFTQMTMSGEYWCVR